MSAYVLSDGAWADTQAGVEKVRRLAEHGVPTIHLSIGIEPLGVECDRIHVITDPPTRSTASPPTPSAPSGPPPAGDPPRDPPERTNAMPNPSPATPNPALLPDPPLFDVTDIAQPTVEGRLERVALEHLTLAPNPRGQLSADGIDRLAGLLMRTGQLIPCIGRRPHPGQRTVVLFDGQHRLLAARASHRLAGTEASKASPP